MRLDEDTAVHGSEGRYQARLSPDWRIWSPNGGYLATIALRAAGRETAFRFPASLSFWAIRAAWARCIPACAAGRQWPSRHSRV